MSTEYRRRLKSDVWHFATTCQHWPQRAFKSTSIKPRSGELCNECRAKARRLKG